MTGAAQSKAQNQGKSRLSLGGMKRTLIGRGRVQMGKLGVRLER